MCELLTGLQKAASRGLVGDTEAERRPLGLELYELGDLMGVRFLLQILVGSVKDVKATKQCSSIWHHGTMGPLDTTAPVDLGTSGRSVSQRRILRRPVEIKTWGDGRDGSFAPLICIDLSIQDFSKIRLDRTTLSKFHKLSCHDHAILREACKSLCLGT